MVDIHSEVCDDRSHDDGVGCHRPRLAEVVALDAGSDEALLVRVGTSDRAAMERLYDRFAARVFGLVAEVVGHPARSCEVTCLVWAEIWRTAPWFDPTAGDAGWWILGLAHRYAVQAARCDRAGGRPAEAGTPMTADRVGPGGSPTVDAGRGS